MTPEQLFQRYRDEGDAHALGGLFDQLAPRLILVATRLVDANSAEDVVQSTFLDAIEHRDRWDQERPLVPWLIGLLGMQVRRSRRSAARKPDQHRLGLREVLDDQGSPRTQAEIQEVLSLVHAEVDRLPRNYRRVLLLRLIDGLTVPQIANRLDQPLGTVKTQLHRGLDLLRRALPPALAGALALFAFPATSLAAARAVVLAQANLFAQLIKPAAPVAVATQRAASELLTSPRVIGLSMLVVIGAVATWFGLRQPLPAPPAGPVRAVVEEPPAPDLVRGADLLALRRSAPGAVAEGEDVAHAPIVRFVIREEATGAAVPFARIAYVVRDLDWANEEAELVKQLRSVGGNCAFDQFAAVGEEVVADAAGRISLPLQHRMFLACRAPGRYGELARIATTYDWRAEQVLQLRPDRSLRVRVVDASGRGLAGLRVRAVPTAAGSPIAKRSVEGDRSAYSMLSDQDGFVTVRNVRHWALGRSGYGPEPGTPDADGCRLELVLPGAAPRGDPVNVPLANLPVEPIELVAPGFGGIDLVVVGQDGQDVDADQQLWLSPAAPDQAAGDARLATTMAGHSSLRHVGLGQEYDVGLTGVSAEPVMRVVGPSFDGEVVRARVALPPGCLAVRGQLVGLGGLPVGGRVRLEIHVGARRLRVECVAKADGRFCHVLPAQRLVGFVDRAPHLVTVQRRRLFAGSLLAAIVRWDKPLSPGDCDLGRIELGPMPAIVAGVLRIDGDPAPAGLACDGIGVDELRVEHRASTAASWGRLACQCVEWLDQARFVVRGLVAPGELRLVATSRLHLAVPPITVEPGADDLVVDLVSGSDLRAELRLDEALAVHHFGATLRRVGQDAPARVGYSEGGGAFVWRGVPQGRYNVELQVAGCSEAVWGVEDILINSDGSCDEPRLREIDLRARFEYTDVQVSAASGKALSGEALIWNGAREDCFATVTVNGRARVAGAASRQFWVAAPGYVPRSVTTSQARLSVELKPMSTVRLALPELFVAAGEELRLVVERDPPAAFDLEAVANAGGGRRIALARLLGLRASYVLGDARVLSVQARPGERLNLSAWRVNAVGGERIAVVEPASVPCSSSKGPPVSIRVVGWSGERGSGR